MFNVFSRSEQPERGGARPCTGTGRAQGVRELLATLHLAPSPLQVMSSLVLLWLEMLWLELI